MEKEEKEREGGLQGNKIHVGGGGGWGKRRSRKRRRREGK